MKILEQRVYRGPSILSLIHILFQADVGFVLVDEQGAERLLGGPLPPAWRQFCR